MTVNMNATMTNTKSPQTRIQGLDLIRIFATFAVVLIHCLFQLLFLEDVETVYSMTTPFKLFYFSCVTIGALGVPLFLMLSGYLLIPRDYDWTKTKKFYKRNFLTILLVWELWIPINTLTAWNYHGMEFHKTDFLNMALFLQMQPIAHFWYLPVILGIYVFIPTLSRAFKALSDKEFLIPLILIFVYIFVFPSLAYIKGIKYDIRLDLGFAGGFFGTHVVLGYAFHRFEQQLKSYFSKGQLIALIVILIAAMTVVQMWLPVKNGSIYHLWYDFFLIPPTTMAIFLLLKDIKFTRLSKLVENISTCSFGIYLIHMAVILFLERNGYIDFANGMAAKVIALTVMVPILSFSSVFFLRKVPYLGKLLFR